MQNKRNGYYDFDMDFEAIMIEAGMVDEMFRLQDLKNRKLFLNEHISQDTIHEVVKHILQYNSDDKGVDPADRKPILLYVVSKGGDVDAGFELIDVVQNSKTPSSHH